MQVKQQALVIGASGGIGAAVARLWAADPRFDQVYALSRASAPRAPLPGLIWRQTAHAEEEIGEQVRDIVDRAPHLSRVAITLGTLHGNDHAPEKSLDALSPEAMQTVHYVNCVLPMLWVRELGKALRRHGDCRIAVLSARVGSIGDNRLGGWISYRSAKAALNMALRCAAIECARRAKGVKLLAYHPGTVDTPLSAPFQRSVAEGKLFAPEYAARCLDEVLTAHAPDGELSYVDWAGERIAW